jgi:oligopeptidase A
VEVLHNCSQTFCMGNSSIVIYCFLARPTQDREIFELQEFAISRGFEGSIQLWDLPYWRRKQHSALFGYGHFL